MTDLKTKDKTFLHWQAPEFNFIEKSSSWYLILGLVSLVLIIIFIYLGYWQKQLSYYLAAGVVLAAALALFSQARIQPKDAQFKCDDSGVEVGNRRYPWENLKNFWLADMNINFQLKKRLSIPLSAPVGDQDPQKVRAFLMQYLPEKTTEGEPIIDRINRLFKF